MTAQLMDPTYWHYAVRFERLVHALVAVNDVYEHLSPNGKGDVLEQLLPAVSDVYGCWAELQEPLEQLDRLDGVVAADIMRDRGHRHPNPADAMGALQDELRQEIAAVISRYRTVTPAQPTGLRAVPA